MSDSSHNPELGLASEEASANPDVSSLRDLQLNLRPQCEARLAAVLNVARYHGVELSLETLRLRAGDHAPNPPELIAWLQEAGLWSRGVHLNVRQLLKIDSSSPVILLLDDGGAALLVGHDSARSLLVLRDPRQPTSTSPIFVDELRLKQVWSGACLLIRASRHGTLEQQPFNLSLVARLVGVIGKFCATSRLHL